MRVKQVNTDILRQCREQIGLAPDDVQKKVASIISIESGERLPTFKQLDTLGKLYEVPRWVFITDSLPEQYQFDQSVPAFRQFANDEQSNVFDNYKVRRLTVRVETLRSDIIELRQDMGEPVAAFQSPIAPNTSAVEAANKVREWLATKDSFDFSDWKVRLEDKGIFVFMTDKYKGWSHIDKDKSLFRGLALYDPILPVIIINNSDARKAQTFTLFHELGHLLRHKSAIDGWSDNARVMEKWCDEFAGNLLMPEKQILQEVTQVTNLDEVKALAKPFKVSPYMALVRLKQINLIDQDSYSSLHRKLQKEYETLQKKLKENKGGPARNRPKEVQQQYGKIYVNALFQAYNNQEIGLHRLSQALGLKRVADVFKVGAQT